MKEKEIVISRENQLLSWIPIKIKTEDKIFRKIRTKTKTKIKLTKYDDEYINFELKIFGIKKNIQKIMDKEIQTSNFELFYGSGIHIANVLFWLSLMLLICIILLVLSTSNYVFFLYGFLFISFSTFSIVYNSTNLKRTVSI